jgi:hypothetical protein
VAKIRGGETASPGRSPYAYTDVRHTPASPEDGGGREQVPRRAARTPRGAPVDAGIDFIPDGDAPASESPRGPGSRRSSEISFGERWHRDQDGGGELMRGKSAEIPLEERFESSHQEPEKLSKGKSAEIPLDERFESAQKEREKKLSPGRSADIPYGERRGGRDS